VQAVFIGIFGQAFYIAPAGASIGQLPKGRLLGRRKKLAGFFKGRSPLNGIFKGNALELIMKKASKTLSSRQCVFRVKGALLL